MVTILIVDDYEPVRRGIRHLLETQPEWRVCGEASNGVEALDKIDELLPQIVLMDIQMPELDGLAATRRSVEANPQVKIIILSQHESGYAKQNAMAAGAYGFVPKSEVGRVLITAVSKVSNGQSFFS